MAREKIPKSTRLAVRVKPRSSKTGVVGERGGAVEVAVRAPPVDGAANAELVRVLAKLLGVPKSSVTVVVGATARDKVVLVEGLDEAEVRRALAGPRR